jgi:hypothetical protein
MYAICRVGSIRSLLSHARLFAGAAVFFAAAFLAALPLAAAPLAWRALPPTDGVVRAFAVYDPGDGAVLVAAGMFTFAGDVAANSIAQWDGVQWQPLGSGIASGSSGVYALAVYDDGSGEKLYAGGLFISVGGVATNSIAVWDGNAWAAVPGGGTGEFEQVRAFEVYDSDGAGALPAQLVVGGVFSSIGGIAASNSAALTGSTWSQFGGGANGGVLSLRVHDGAIYAGGEFDSVGNRITRSTGGAWTPFTSGMTNGSDSVYALGVIAPGGTPVLYAAGEFANAAGAATHDIALYNGGAGFTPLGAAANEGTNNYVAALAPFFDGVDLRLFVGGGFTTVAGSSVTANRLATWNGSAWSAVGAGTGMNGDVLALLPMYQDIRGPSLYVGGTFTHVDGQPSRGIARYSRDEEFRLRVVLDGPGSGEVNSSDAQIACPDECDAFYAGLLPAATPFLTAQAGAGSAFTGWSGDCSEATETVQVTMDQPRECVARFEIERSLTVTRSGVGSGTVTSSPLTGIDCGAICSAVYLDGSVVTLAAIADADSIFTGWSGDCAGTGAEVDVTLDAARTCNADFAIVRTLTIPAFSGGTVTSSPGDIDCPSSTCQADFADGTAVTLTAVPDAPRQFLGWIGDCSGGDPDIVLQMTADLTCTPEFSTLATLEIVPGGDGSGHVVSNPAGIDCGSTCSAVFNTGNVALTATAAPGSRFFAWSGCAFTTDNVLALDLQEDEVCNPVFRLTRTVSIAVTGQGHVVSPEISLDCTGTCSATVDNQTLMVLTAQPDAGWRFVAWGGDCAVSNPAAVHQVFLTTDLTCTALFEPSQRLTITVLGTGGEVSSSPVGIDDCIATCEFDFPSGEEVTLAASTTSPFVFIGWTGACSGTDPVVVLSMTQARTCTAEFQLGVYIEVGASGHGRVLVPEAGIDCIPGSSCFEFLPVGSVITLIAAPLPGATFESWHGVCAGNAAAQITITLDTGKSCSATFLGGEHVFGSGFEASP